MKRSTVLYPGDIVVINLKFSLKGDSRFDLKVTEVIERFGTHPDGRLQNHLVKGTNLKTGEDSTYDFGYITEIKSRAGKRQLGLPKNIFRDYIPEVPHYNTNQRVAGPLIGLVKVELGKLPVEIVRPLHVDRMCRLFFKDMPGVSEITTWNPHTLVCVRKKTFRGWVKRNHTRLIRTRKELDKEATQDLAYADQCMKADMEAGFLWGDPFFDEESWDPYDHDHLEGMYEMGEMAQ